METDKDHIHYMIETEPGKMLAKPFYQIRLIEEKYTSEWTVCADHSVYSKGGRVYTETDALDNWLKNIEASAGFDHSMLDRAPGNNYLCLICVLRGKSKWQKETW